MSDKWQLTRHQHLLPIIPGVWIFKCVCVCVNATLMPMCIQFELTNELAITLKLNIRLSFRTTIFCRFTTLNDVTETYNLYSPVSREWIAIRVHSHLDGFLHMVDGVLLPSPIAAIHTHTHTSTQFSSGQTHLHTLITKCCVFAPAKNSTQYKLWPIKIVMFQRCITNKIH